MMKQQWQEWLMTIVVSLWLMFMLVMALRSFPGYWPLIAIAFLGVSFSAIVDSKVDKDGGVDGLPAIVVPRVWVVVIVLVALLWAIKAIEH